MTQAPKQIFVVGNSRSGTTMMGRILGKHPKIFTFNELHYFEQLWSPSLEPEPVDRNEVIRQFASLLTIQRDGYYAQQPLVLYRQEAQSLADQMTEPYLPPDVFARFLQAEAAQFGKTIACDQTPRNVYYLREILALYQDARIVNIVRDPRDVLLSQKNRWRRRFLGADTPLRQSIRVWSTYHPLTTSLIWRSGVRAGDRYRSHPRVHQIRFESLVSAPQKSLEDLCRFLQIDFSDAMLEVPKVGSSVKSDERQSLGIDSTAAGRWQSGGLSQTEIWFSQRISADEMADHEYALMMTRLSYLEILWHTIILPVKMALAFVMNVGRAKNPVESLRRRFGVQSKK